jgi:hypothetical protein
VDAGFAVAVDVDAIGEGDRGAEIPDGANVATEDLLDGDRAGGRC